MRFVIIGFILVAMAAMVVTAHIDDDLHESEWDLLAELLFDEVESDAMSMWPEPRCSSAALNVRDGPNIHARVLYTMSPGTRVTVNGVTNGVWANIGPGKFCHTDYLKPCAAETKCSTDYLNVRDGPSMNARVLYTMNPGTQVTVHSISGVWANIGAGKFCHKDYLGPCGGGGGKAPMYKQCDGRWGSHRLGSTGTICSIGCLMTTVAMGMTHHGKHINGQTANPAVLNGFLNSNGGYQGNLYIWGAVSRFGLSYQGQTRDQGTIRAACNNGRKIVALNVNGGGHWVLCTGVTGNGFTVNDPGANKHVYGFGEVVLAGIYNV